MVHSSLPSALTLDACSLGAAVQEIERHRFLKDLRADCDYDHLFVDGEALVKKIDPAFRETYDAQAAPFIIAAANYVSLFSSLCGVISLSPSRY